MKKPVVTIVTATKLTTSQKKVVVEALQQKLGSVDIDEVVDPTIIGGLKIKLGNQEFDASLSGKLERLETIAPAVQVISAVELSDAQRKRIKTAIEERFGSTTLTEVIDPTIIGGIKIIAGSTELDATVKGRLDKLRQQLLNNI